MIIEPSVLKGDIHIQPSKSMSHRLAICAALAGSGSRVNNIAESDDIHATLGALESLGIAGFARDGNDICVKEAAAGKGRVDCIESGSTLRFLIPVSLLYGGAEFIGQGRLMQRPLDPYERLFSRDGTWQKNGNTLTIRGQLKPGRYALRADISSQFVSGLLLALPLLHGDSQIDLLPPVESKGYIDMTMEAMRIFGVNAAWLDEERIGVGGNQRYRPAAASVEGDYSHAAFFLCAGAMGGDVRCLGLKETTAQGDRAILDILKSMGANAGYSGGAAYAKGRVDRGVVIDVAQIPDLVPVIAACACAVKGVTRIENAQRLRIKESDRLSAVASELSRLGADIIEGADDLEIRGHGRLTGGRCFAHNDHRIAMALTVAASICDNEVELEGHGAVSKSAPAFFQQYNNLGGRAYERDVGASLFSDDIR